MPNKKGNKRRNPSKRTKTPLDSLLPPPPHLDPHTHPPLTPSSPPPILPLSPLSPPPPPVSPSPPTSPLPRSSRHHDHQPAQGFDEEENERNRKVQEQVDHQVHLEALSQMQEMDDDMVEAEDFRKAVLMSLAEEIEIEEHKDEVQSRVQSQDLNSNQKRKDKKKKGKGKGKGKKLDKGSDKELLEEFIFPEEMEGPGKLHIDVSFREVQSPDHAADKQKPGHKNKWWMKERIRNSNKSLFKKKEEEEEDGAAQDVELQSALRDAQTTIPMPTTAPKYFFKTPDTARLSSLFKKPSPSENALSAVGWNNNGGFKKELATSPEQHTEAQSGRLKIEIMIKPGDGPCHVNGEPETHAHKSETNQETTLPSTEPQKKTKKKNKKKKNKKKGHQQQQPSNPDGPSILPADAEIAADVLKKLRLERECAELLHNIQNMGADLTQMQSFGERRLAIPIYTPGPSPLSEVSDENSNLAAVSGPVGSTTYRFVRHGEDINCFPGMQQRNRTQDISTPATKKSPGHIEQSPLSHMPDADAVEHRRLDSVMGEMNHDSNSGSGAGNMVLAKEGRGHGSSSAVHCHVGQSLTMGGSSIVKSGMEGHTEVDSQPQSLPFPTVTFPSASPVAEEGTATNVTTLTNNTPTILPAELAIKPDHMEDLLTPEQMTELAEVFDAVNNAVSEMGTLEICQYSLDQRQIRPSNTAVTNMEQLPEGMVMERNEMEVVEYQPIARPEMKPQPLPFLDTGACPPCFSTAQSKPSEPPSPDAEPIAQVEARLYPFPPPPPPPRPSYQTLSPSPALLASTSGSPSTARQTPDFTIPPLTSGSDSPQQTQPLAIAYAQDSHPSSGLNISQGCFKDCTIITGIRLYVEDESSGPFEARSFVQVPMMNATPKGEATARLEIQHEQVRLETPGQRHGQKRGNSDCDYPANKPYGSKYERKWLDSICLRHDSSTGEDVAPTKSGAGYENAERGDVRPQEGKVSPKANPFEHVCEPEQRAIHNNSGPREPVSNVTDVQATTEDSDNPDTVADHTDVIGACSQGIAPDPEDNDIYDPRHPTIDLGSLLARNSTQPSPSTAPWNLRPLPSLPLPTSFTKQINSGYRLEFHVLRFPPIPCVSTAANVPNPFSSIKINFRLMPGAYAPRPVEVVPQYGIASESHINDLEEAEYSYDFPQFSYIRPLLKESWWGFDGRRDMIFIDDRAVRGPVQFDHAVQERMAEIRRNDEIEVVPVPRTGTGNGKLRYEGVYKIGLILVDLSDFRVFSEFMTYNNPYELMDIPYARNPTARREESKGKNGFYAIPLMPRGYTVDEMPGMAFPGPLELIESEKSPQITDRASMVTAYLRLISEGVGVQTRIKVHEPPPPPILPPPPPPPSAQEKASSRVWMTGPFPAREFEKARAGKNSKGLEGLRWKGDNNQSRQENRNADSSDNHSIPSNANSVPQPVEIPGLTLLKVPASIPATKYEDKASLWMNDPQGLHRLQHGDGSDTTSSRKTKARLLTSDPYSCKCRMHKSDLKKNPHKKKQKVKESGRDRENWKNDEKEIQQQRAAAALQLEEKMLDRQVVLQIQCTGFRCADGVDRIADFKQA